MTMIHDTSQQDVILVPGNLHAKSPTLSMPKPIVQSSSLVNLALSLFITHEPSSDTHITLVVPYTPIIFFDITFLFVLLKE